MLSSLLRSFLFLANSSSVTMAILGDAGMTEEVPESAMEGSAVSCTHEAGGEVTLRVGMEVGALSWEVLSMELERLVVEDRMLVCSCKVTAGVAMTTG